MAKRPGPLGSGSPGRRWLQHLDLDIDRVDRAGSDELDRYRVLCLAAEPLLVDLLRHEEVLLVQLYRGEPTDHLARVLERARRPDLAAGRESDVLQGARREPLPVEPEEDLVAAVLLQVQRGDVAGGEPAELDVARRCRGGLRRT